MHLNPNPVVNLPEPLPIASLPLALVGEEPGYPRHVEGVPPGVLRAGRYEARFARSAADLRAVQRLRFDVFNLELHEGLAGSYATGLDQDAFDVHCHHLMVCEADSGEVVGTYRLMTRELAPRERLYSHSEFDLSEFPEHVVARGTEVGRACVARAHRNGRVLQLLWRGIARYMDWNDKRYVFGCCSVPSLDPHVISALSAQLTNDERFHPRVRAPVHAAYASARVSGVVPSGEPVSLPPLFASYLRLGAKVCGGPAFDQEFGVTDYLVLLDLRDVDERTLSGLSAPGLWKTQG